MTTPRKKPTTPKEKPTEKQVELLPEDLLLDVVVYQNSKQEILRHYVRADYIYRVSESADHRNRSCAWVAGEDPDQPLVVNTDVETLYLAWQQGRANIYSNQNAML
jgi:hypothetical protein